MVELSQYIAIIQIPIIGIIIYFCHQIYSKFKFEPFLFIKYGFISNLLYISISIISHSNFSIFDTSKLDVFLDSFEYLFDFSSAYFIFYATRYFALKVKIYDLLVPYNLNSLKWGYIIMCIIMITNIFYKNTYNQHLIHLSCSLIMANSYYTLSIYFFKIFQKYQVGIGLIYGIIIYIFVQFTPYIAFLVKNTNHSSLIMGGGFLFGLLSKILILLGLHNIISSKFEKKKLDYKDKYEVLNRNVFRAFHELNRPLLNLSNKVEELLNFRGKKYDFDNKTMFVLENLESSAEHIRVLMASSNKILTTEKSLLNFAVVLDDKEYKFENLNVIIQTVISVLKSEILTKRKLKIEIKESFSKNCSILCNESDITQIAFNLIVNAVESIPKDKRGLITVTTKKSKNFPDYIELNIVDNGIGMNQEDKKYIYKEGFSTKEKEKFAKRGFGLTIVKEIITFYKGIINFESDLGKGTIFTISIPKNFKELSENNG